MIDLLPSPDRPHEPVSKASEAQPLRTGDEIFRQLVEQTQDQAIVVLAPTGLISAWNLGARRLTGYEAAEVLGRSFSCLYPAAARQQDGPGRDLQQAALGTALTREGWRVRKDGSEFWARSTLTALHDAQGRLSGYSEVLREVMHGPGAGNEHERTLRNSERDLRLLVDGVQDYAIFSLDVGGVITSWNRGAQRIKGYTAQEVIGRHFSIFYDAEAIASDWPAEELRRAAALGRYEDEGWRVRKDGQRIWVNVVLTGMRDESNHLVGFSKVTRDLTERRRHEELLREREESFRLLVDGVKDHALFLLDPQGRIKTWNAGATRLLGYDADDVVLADFGMLYPEEERAEKQPQADLNAAELAGTLRLQAWRIAAGGRSFWAESTITALRTASGQLRGFVQVVRDLTAERRVQVLEGERQRLSEFIAMLSHELRNPLAPMKNAIAVLMRSRDRPQANECIDLIDRQIDHLTRLIDDLLDVSRVTNGKIRLRPEPLDLGALLRQVADSVRDGAAAKGLQLNVAGAASAPVLGDATRLTQVVLNLLNNAIKYTPAGGRIEVTLAATEQLATLRIDDDGIGMAQDLLSRVFEPFMQGARGLERSEGGLGIGLTIVRRIVELHGGQVHASSPGMGRGSRFEVVLPIHRAAEAAAGAAPETRAGAPAKVLVVDDNRDAAESLGALLRLFGHEVQIAYDGPQAITYAASFAPELALLDIGLPGMDGFQLAEKLRALPSLQACRLVALTGYGQDEDRAATAAAGFEVHLTKPVSPDELMRLFRAQDLYAVQPVFSGLA